MNVISFFYCFIFSELHNAESGMRVLVCALPSAMGLDTLTSAPSAISHETVKYVKEKC